jgi:nitrite reductase/ring-hydroxylating ferredoxin subunit
MRQESTFITLPSTVNNDEPLDLERGSAARRAVLEDCAWVVCPGHNASIDMTNVKLSGE